MGGRSRYARACRLAAGSPAWRLRHPRPCATQGRLLGWVLQLGVQRQTVRDAGAGSSSNTNPPNVAICACLWCSDALYCDFGLCMFVPVAVVPVIVVCYQSATALLPLFLLHLLLLLRLLWLRCVLFLALVARLVARSGDNVLHRGSGTISTELT